MEQTESNEGAICRLVRADGTEWRVQELRGFEEGLRVDAVRAGPRPAADTAVGNGSPDRGSHVSSASLASNGSPASSPSSSSGGSPASNGSGHSRLEDELLGRGDRLQWLDEDGDVLWSMKLPMDQARSA